MRSAAVCSSLNPTGQNTAPAVPPEFTDGRKQKVNGKGGIPSLTAAVVVAVGLLGAICGFKTMKIMHVGSPIAQGLSMGTAAHAVGTSTAMDISSKYGAYASLGLTLNGIFTALLTPTILRLLGVL